MMAWTGKPEAVLPEGETASAKRTQRSMQAVGRIVFFQKMTQPRQNYKTDGDALTAAEANTEGAQMVCSGRSVGVHKTVACIQGSALELGRPVDFLLGGSEPTTKGRGTR